MNIIIMLFLIFIDENTNQNISICIVTDLKREYDIIVGGKLKFKWIIFQFN